MSGFFSCVVNFFHAMVCHHHMEYDMRSFIYLLIFTLCVGGHEFTSYTTTTTNLVLIPVPVMGSQFPVYLRQPMPKPKCDDYRCIH